MNTSLVFINEYYNAVKNNTVTTEQRNQFYNIYNTINNVPEQIICLVSLIHSALYEYNIDNEKMIDNMISTLISEYKILNFDHFFGDYSLILLITELYKITYSKTILSKETVVNYLKQLSLAADNTHPIIQSGINFQILDYMKTTALFKDNLDLVSQIMQNITVDITSEVDSPFRPTMRKILYSINLEDF